MKRFCLLVAVLFSSAMSMAQHPPIERDGQRARAEILRRGDMVEQVGAGPRAADSELFAQAMEPPADDQPKWFISVVTMRGCQPCAQLTRDFRENDYLRALGNLEDRDMSWSNLNFYDKDDASQAFRWRNIKFKGYPTIIIQPPRDGRFGPNTVVDQITGYDGDAAKLARRITASIRLYLRKLTETRNVDMRRFRPTGHRPVSHRADDCPCEDCQCEPCNCKSAFRASLRTAEQLLRPAAFAGDIGQRTPPWSPRPKDDVAPVTPAPPSPFDIPVFPFDQPVDPEGEKPDERKPDGDGDGEKELPEAVLVVDSQNEQPAIEAQAKRFLERLRAERKPLRVRITDWAFAKDLDVKRDETPAVVVRDGDRVEKITGRLLPLLSPEPAPAAPVTIWDLPVESLIAVFGGGGVLAAIPLITWGLRFIRSRRKEAGKPLLVQDDKRFEELLQLSDLARQLDLEKLKAQFRKAPASA